MDRNFKEIEFDKKKRQFDSEFNAAIQMQKLKISNLSKKTLGDSVSAFNRYQEAKMKHQSEIEKHYSTLKMKRH